MCISIELQSGLSRDRQPVRSTQCRGEVAFQRFDAEYGSKAWINRTQEVLVRQIAGPDSDNIPFDHGRDNVESGVQRRVAQTQCRILSPAGGILVIRQTLDLEDAITVRHLRVVVKLNIRVRSQRQASGKSERQSQDANNGVGWFLEQNPPANAKIKIHFATYSVPESTAPSSRCTTRDASSACSREWVTIMMVVPSPLITRSKSITSA